MLYTITAINGNEVTLDKQPPSTAFGLDLTRHPENPNIVITPYAKNMRVGDTMGFGEEKALRYNEGKLRWSLVDWKSMEPMVQVLEFGAKKYEEENWKKPMDKKQILNSMMRHVVKLMDGEEIDSESGLGHIGHIMANALFYSFHSQSNDSK